MIVVNLAEANKRHVSLNSKGLDSFFITQSFHIAMQQRVIVGICGYTSKNDSEKETFYGFGKHMIAG